MMLLPRNSNSTVHLHMKSPKFPLTKESDVLLSTSFLGRSNPRVRPVYLNRTTSLEDSAGRFNSESTHRSSAVSFLLISGASVKILVWAVAKSI
nr:hypothetical protein Iba_chr11bCG1380 [Ipomoea batatas]